MSLKDTFKKAAGLFVELPPTPDEPAEISVELSDTPAKTVETLVRETPGPNLAEIQATTTAIPPVTVKDGAIDLPVLYQHAGLPTAPFTAEQTLDMLTSLPAELPIETKRQTVRATLNAMGKAIGATPDSIVADASRKLAALTAYVENLQKQTAEFTTASELEIASLQAKIASIRKATEATKTQNEQLVAQCHTEADRLDDVLEFFSLDVPPSKYATPGTPDKPAKAGK